MTAVTGIDAYRAEWTHLMQALGLDPIFGAGSLSGDSMVAEIFSEEVAARLIAVFASVDLDSIDLSMRLVDLLERLRPRLATTP